MCVVNERTQGVHVPQLSLLLCYVSHVWQCNMGMRFMTEVVTSFYVPMHSKHGYSMPCQQLQSASQHLFVLLIIHTHVQEAAVALRLWTLTLTTTRAKPNALFTLTILTKKLGKHPTVRHVQKVHISPIHIALTNVPISMPTGFGIFRCHTFSSTHKCSTWSQTRFGDIINGIACCTIMMVATFTSNHVLESHHSDKPR